MEILRRCGTRPRGLRHGGAACNAASLHGQGQAPQTCDGPAPPLVGDFHALDKFGQLVFGDENGATTTVAALVAPTVGDKKADENKKDQNKKDQNKKDDKKKDDQKKDKKEEKSK